MRIRGNWALVPVKGRAAAKSRLSGMLSATQRASLQCAMLTDLLSSLREARLLDGVAVYAPEQPAANFGAAAGTLIFFRQSGHVRDLNAAVTDGVEQLAGLGAEFIAVLPGDLPLLEAEDLDHAFSLVAAQGCRVVIPDRWGTGTNGLVFPAGAPPRFSYGRDSFARHMAHALCDWGGARTLRLELASFSCDIDTLEDMRAFLQEERGARGWRTCTVIDSFGRSQFEARVAEESCL